MESDGEVKKKCCSGSGCKNQNEDFEIGQIDIEASIAAFKALGIDVVRTTKSASPNMKSTTGCCSTTKKKSNCCDGESKNSSNTNTSCCSSIGTKESEELHDSSCCSRNEEKNDENLQNLEVIEQNHDHMKKDQAHHHSHSSCCSKKSKPDEVPSVPSCNSTKSSCCSKPHESTSTTTGCNDEHKHSHSKSSSCCNHERKENTVPTTKTKNCSSKSCCKKKEENDKVAPVKSCCSQPPKVHKHGDNHSVSSSCCSHKKEVDTHHQSKNHGHSHVKNTTSCCNHKDNGEGHGTHSHSHSSCNHNEIKTTVCCKHKDVKFDSTLQKDNNSGFFATRSSSRVKIVTSCCSEACCVNVECKFKVHFKRIASENSSLLHDDNESFVVQSTVFVQHICCASEIPLINDVLQPLQGLLDVKVNTMTKMVNVKHDYQKLSATNIVNTLNKAEFGAKLKIDGAETAMMKKRTKLSNNVQSKIFVSAICCASEIPMINEVVKPLWGTSEVKVNTTTKMVYVNHDCSIISAAEIVSALNRENFGASLELDGGATSEIKTKSRVTSSLVESTFLVTSTFDKSIIQKMKSSLKEKFSAKHIANTEMHILSRTLKIDHNPYMLKAQTINDFLVNQGFDTLVICDGYEEGVWTIDDGNIEQYGEDDNTHNLQMKTILSGMFWLISMLYLLGGKWSHLKYAGLLSVGLSVPKIALKAIATMRRWQFDTNGMMLFATIGAVALQDYSEAASVAFLFGLSEHLEAMCTSRARDALSSIAKLRPERARVKDNATNKFVVVPASSVAVGSVVCVPTGDKVPCDGVVVDGTSTMDESSLTGESRPIRKSVGDRVSGGTLNAGRAQLLIQTTSLADDSAVARLIKLVEEAQTNRSPTELLVDEFAKRYTPLVVILSLSMCTYPWLISAEMGRYFTKMGLITIVVACPCALIISTPVTYVAGIAAAARNGVVVKGGAYLEAMARVKTIAFDKTGTLTEGNFKLLELRQCNATYDRKEVMQYLYVMEENASHPLALALVSAAKSEGVSKPKSWSVKDHCILEGEGVKAVVNGDDVHVGNMRLFERLGMLYDIPSKEVDIAKKWMENGFTVGFVSIGGVGIVGSYCVADAIRREAREVVEAIRGMGIRPIMLSGDNDKAALYIGRRVGLSGEDVKSQLLPQDKLDYIESAVSNGSSRNVSCLSLGRRDDLIMMCGDGVNDAPALTLSDVGVAMGAGAAIAMESADVTLLDSDLRKLLKVMELSKSVSRKIVQNVVFSLVVKGLVLSMTFAGYASLWAAIGSDVGAMMIVTTNSMRLLPSETSMSRLESLSKESSLNERGGDVEEQVPLLV